MPKPEKHVFICTQSRPPGHVGELDSLGNGSLRTPCHGQEKHGQLDVLSHGVQPVFFQCIQFLGQPPSIVRGLPELGVPASACFRGPERRYVDPQLPETRLRYWIPSDEPGYTIAVLPKSRLCVASCTTTVWKPL